MTTPDSAGEGILTANASWTFGAGTAQRFEAHVRRSVPFYDVGHDLVLKLSDFFVHADSICYELGSSTGALTRKLGARHPGSVRWVGLDVEPEMTEEARLRTAEDGQHNLVHLTDDVTAFPYEPSDFMVAYYTVQFVRPSQRQQLIDHIYRSLAWGGAFVLFEKVRSPDARFQDISNALYADFKLEQGYTPDEIIAKTRSLKGVLEPFSTQGNLDLLRRAGFVDITSVFKYLCFEGTLCIK